MRSKLKSERKRSPFLLYMIGFVVLVAVSIGLINMQVEISQKRAECDELKSNLTALLMQNEQLSHYAEDDYKIDYIEQIARDQLDYSLPDETVYYFIPE